jgi:hypothetical protein
VLLAPATVALTSQYESIGIKVAEDYGWVATLPGNYPHVSEETCGLDVSFHRGTMEARFLEGSLPRLPNSTSTGMIDWRP